MSVTIWGHWVKGHKVVNFQVIWMSLIQGICIHNLNTETCTLVYQKLQAMLNCGQTYRPITPCPNCFSQGGHKKIYFLIKEYAIPSILIYRVYQCKQWLARIKSGNKSILLWFIKMITEIHLCLLSLLGSQIYISYNTVVFPSKNYSHYCRGFNTPTTCVYYTPCPRSHYQCLKKKPCHTHWEFIGITCTKFRFITVCHKLL